jgi:PTS system nitrogen regulatory IIA component
MRLKDYLSAERVARLDACGKDEALAAMADLLAPAARGVSRDAIVEAIREREALMSTGIGQGLGIPHVRMAGLSDAVMAVGVCPDGVADYESLDGEPVRILVLIAAPAGRHDLYIRLLALVTDVLKEPELRYAILEAADPPAICRILIEAKA